MMTAGRIDTIDAPHPLVTCIIVAVIISTFTVSLALGPNWFPVDEFGYRDYLGTAAPAFFVLMVLEHMYLTSEVHLVPSEAAKYTFADTWANLSAGAVAGILLKAAGKLSGFGHHFILWPYLFIYANYRIVDLESTWLTALGAFVVSDLIYYWYHRWMHEYVFLWSGHAYHHNSDRFNLSTALRQSWWQAVTGPFVNLAAAFVFPPQIYIPVKDFVLMYQFWYHTCAVRRLGFLENIFVTPSSHRVHHDRRVHKNFGGVLVVWDILFGTFLDELDKTDVSTKNMREELSYFGIAEAMTSFSDSVLQLEHWKPVVSLRRVWKGPGYSTTTSKRVLPATVAMPRIRLATDPNKVTTDVVLLVLLEHIVTLIAISIVGVGNVVSPGKPLTPFTTTLITVYAVISLWCQGLYVDSCVRGSSWNVLDGPAIISQATLRKERLRWRAEHLDILRCAGTFAICVIFSDELRGLAGAERFLGLTEFALVHAAMAAWCAARSILTI